VDFYHIKFESDYSSTFDNVTGDTIYFKNGASITQGSRGREHDPRRRRPRG